VVEVVNEAVVNNAVHGAMILVVLLTLAAYFIYSYQRGFNKLLVILAQLFFFIGSMVMVGAALINGFIYTDFIAQLVGANSEVLTHVTPIKSLTWSANQVLANMGVITMSIAMVFWSIDVFSDGSLQKGIGWYGILIGFWGFAAIAFDFMSLDLQGMTAIVVLQGLWHLSMAYLMISKTVDSQ